MRRILCALLPILAALTAVAPAQTEPVTWLVTEWGSVYRNLQKVADRQYEEPQQIAGTAEHYWVTTRDGSVWKDGARVVQGVHKDENVTDLDARGDDYYLLTLQGRLYKNGQVSMAEGTIQRPHQLIVRGSDVFIMDETGQVYRNGSPVGERYYLGGYYPTHFATDGTDFWFDISAGTGAGGGSWIYRNREKANPETWVVRELGWVGGHFYIFSGRSVFRDYQRVAKFEPDVRPDIASKDDNPIDFHFVLP